MPGWSIRSRAPQGLPRNANALDTVQRDADVLRTVLEDAAHFPGGHAEGLVSAASEADVAQALAGRDPGAADRRAVVAHRRRDADGRNRARDDPPEQASSTSAPTRCASRPASRWPISTPALAPRGPLLSAGADLHGRLRRRHRRHQRGGRGDVQVRHDARLGATPSPSCCRAASVLDIERGARPRPRRRLLRDRVRRAARPACRCPPTACRRRAKLSAGYFAAPEMDLIDLFIGSRRHARRRHRGDAARAAGPAGDVPGVRAVRDSRRRAGVRPPAARTAHATRGARTIRTASTCRRSSTWTRAASSCCARTASIASTASRIPAGTEMALLVTLELPAGDDRAPSAFEDIGNAREPDAPDTPLAPLLPAARRRRRPRRRRDRGAGRSRAGEPAAGGARSGAGRRQPARRPREADHRRAHREDRGRHDRAVRSARRAADGLRDRLRRRGLDAAIWGHISDGNLHPNVIPRSLADVESGKAAILEFGREAIRLGGAPLAEHGVGPQHASSSSCSSSSTARKASTRCAP